MDLATWKKNLKLSDMDRCLSWVYMEFVLLQTFTNYMEAHIIYGRLESSGIRCWLKDEHTVTINPIWSQTVGGIKLMVAKDQAEQALELITRFEADRREHFVCPVCKSGNIELVSSNRKAGNWIQAIIGFLITINPPVEKVWHCFDCNAEFETPYEVGHQ